MMPEFDYCSWSRNIRDKMMGEEQTLRWRLDAPWVCDMDWDWDIKRWVLRRIVSRPFPMFCTGFLDRESLIIKMLFIKSKRKFK